MMFWDVPITSLRLNNSHQCHKEIPGFLNPIQDGHFQGAHPENLSHIFYNGESWQSYTLPKEDLKNI